MKAKRISKKHKHSWRKHIDDTDVDAFFENKRLEERLGKPFELRDDAEIFKIDTRPGPLIRDSILAPSRKPDASSLRCLQGLQNTSAVPDPLIKRNTIRSKKQRQHPILKKKNEIRRDKGLLKRKEIIELKNYFLKRAGSLTQKNRRRNAVKEDLWTEMNEPSKLTNLKDWFDETTLLHAVRNTSDLPVNSAYRPQAAETVIPSFEKPHPGISYNPSFIDHLDVANEVANLEMETQKKEKHLDRVTSKLFKQIPAEQNERNWLKEMSEGLPSKEHVAAADNIKNEDTDDIEYCAINPPVTREKKKTIKQKKKQLRNKQEEQKKREIKQQKKKASDICKIKYIIKEIEHEELKQEKKSLKRLQKSARKFQIPRRVGKNEFVLDEPTIADVGELTGSLREIIPQGNVLRDELRNLQRRNLIEVTKPQFKNKKKKMKKYNLKSHRSERLEFSAKELLKSMKRL